MNLFCTHSKIALMLARSKSSKLYSCLLSKYSKGIVVLSFRQKWKNICYSGCDIHEDVPFYSPERKQIHQTGSQGGGSTTYSVSSYPILSMSYYWRKKKVNTLNSREEQVLKHQRRNSRCSPTEKRRLDYCFHLAHHPQKP